MFRMRPKYDNNKFHFNKLNNVSKISYNRLSSSNTVIYAYVGYHRIITFLQFLYLF